MKSSEKEDETKYEVGDVVWVRFGGIRGCWEVATIVRIEGSTLNVVPGKNVKLYSESDHRVRATYGVDPTWVCAMNKAKDVPSPSYTFSQNTSRTNQSVRGGG